MRTITADLFTFNELTQKAKTAARELFTRSRDEDPETPWADETMDSLKALAACLGLRMSSWSLGTSDNRGQDITLADNERTDLTGNRARAFTARRLMAAGYSRPTFPGWKMTFPGLCPFTGYCADDDFAESLWENLSDGSTLRQAFENLASTFADLSDADRAQMYDDESFSLWTEDREFTADGTPTT